MILKVLLVLGVIGIVYFMFIKKKPANISKTKANKKETPKADDMVECSSCGVYAQVSESLLSGSKYYCCKECLNAKG